MKKQALPNNERKLRIAVPFTPIEFTNVASSTNGISYPPKYKVEITTELINMLMYSANKKNPIFIEEYSE